MPRADRLEDLVPHAGSMCLLEYVLDCTPERILTGTGTHRCEDNPLRSRGRLRAVHLCEYGSQAMAVHGGLLAREAGGRAPPGMLVSLREVSFGIGFLEALPGDLMVEATRLHGTPAGWQYAFRVTHEGVELAHGRATVILHAGRG